MKNCLLKFNNFFFSACAFAFAMLLNPLSIQAQAWKADAATSWNGQYAYFFNGNQYSRYDVGTAKIGDGYPLTISGNFANGWPQSWSSIDAAANIGAEKVYFFKGNQYLRYDTKSGKVDNGYPLAIQGNFCNNWPSGWANVDAAVNLENGNIYFFRGRDYIRYNIQTAKATAPAAIAGNFAKSWPDWPSVDAAVNYGNGNVYFFRGDEYFRYKIDGATVSEPQKVVGNFMHAPAPADPATALKLIKVKCIKPATGVELGVIEDISDATTAAGVALAGVGLAAVKAGPKVTIAVALAGAAVGGVSLGTWVATKVDKSRSPDQLFLKLNNKKVWPGGDYRELEGGDEANLNIDLPLNSTLELMEYDSGSGDDSMGTVTFSNFAKGTYEMLVQSSKEDSLYMLVIEAY